VIWLFKSSRWWRILITIRNHLRPLLIIKLHIKMRQNNGLMWDFFYYWKLFIFTKLFTMNLVWRVIFSISSCCSIISRITIKNFEIISNVIGFNINKNRQFLIQQYIFYSKLMDSFLQKNILKMSSSAAIFFLFLRIIIFDLRS